MRKYHSFKDELIRKSREAMLAAVQIYNNPSMTFKSETYITLSIIAWTYLLHAYYKSKSIDYRYYSMQGTKKRYDKTKYGAYKRWELERCLNTSLCPIDNESKANLKFLIGIRHEIEHQMTDKIDRYISAKLQACAINYDYYIIKLFGKKYNISNELALAIQFSPISPEQQENLNDNQHITTNVKNFICEYENSLSSDTIRDSKYAYRILFVPYSVNRKGQADRVIEFAKPDSSIAKEAERIVFKETEKPKYLPKEIVNLMQRKGFSNFNITQHTNLWKKMPNIIRNTGFK